MDTAIGLHIGVLCTWVISAPDDISVNKHFLALIVLHIVLEPATFGKEVDELHLGSCVDHTIHES